MPPRMQRPGYTPRYPQSTFFLEEDGAPYGSIILSKLPRTAGHNREIWQVESCTLFPPEGPGTTSSLRIVRWNEAAFTVIPGPLEPMFTLYNEERGMFSVRFPDLTVLTLRFDRLPEREAGIGRIYAFAETGRGEDLLRTFFRNVRLALADIHGQPIPQEPKDS